LGPAGIFWILLHSMLSRVFRKNLAQHGQQGFQGLAMIFWIFFTQQAQQGF
jgi:hypothetical protein